MPTITASTTRPCRLSLTILPNVDDERERDEQEREDLEEVGEPVGFSNGCAELALNGPPPLVPSSLIASWLANGPPGIVLRR